MLPYAVTALVIWMACIAIIYLRREEAGFVRVYVLAETWGTNLLKINWIRI